MDVRNIEKLRSDLKKYFESAMFITSPVAIMDLIKVESATDEELIKIAKWNGFDIEKY